ncbi:GTP-binding protein [Nocardia veterana]|nr:GTP-binding protein [Nocardia veterana]
MARHPRVDLEYRNTMGIEAIEPQSIRNVTIVGDPGPVARLTARLPIGGRPIHWVADHATHTIRLAELSTQIPAAELERSIRVADGLVVVVDAATANTRRLETALRVADDHQVARLCLVTGLGRPGADFDRSVRTIADARGAVPVPVHLPLGIGAEFDGVLDLVRMWELEPTAPEFFGGRWAAAEHRYRRLVEAVFENDSAPDARPRGLRPEWLYDRIRDRTRIGDAVPVLCDPAPHRDDRGALLDAIVRFLPSPLQVCQPEHALDY